MSAPAMLPTPEPRGPGHFPRDDVTLAAIEKARRDLVRVVRVITAAGERHPDLGVLRDLEALARYNLTEVIAAGRHWAEAREAYEQAAAAYDRAAMAAILGEPLPVAAPEPEPEPARQRARASHRKRPHGHLSPVDGARQAAPAILAPAAFWAAARAFAAAGKVAGKHAWAAHAMPITATAAGTALIAGAVAFTPQTSQTLDYRTTLAAVPPPSLHLQDASPVAAPSPSAGASTLTNQGHRYRPRHARKPVLPDPGPSSSPSPGPSPSPSAAARGTLLIQQQGGLAIGPSRTAVLVVEAGNGPVVWTASSPDPRVTLSVDGSDPDLTVHGGLAAGGSDEIAVTVDPAAMIQPGSAVITVNGQPVTVSWGR